MAKPLISRQGTTTLLRPRVSKVVLFISLGLMVAFVVVNVVVFILIRSPLALIFAALFLFSAVLHVMALPTALEPTTLVNGVLSVPRFSLRRGDRRRTFELAGYQHAGLSLILVGSGRSKRLMWCLFLWKDSRTDPHRIPGFATSRVGRKGSDLQQKLAATNGGQVASLLDAEIATRHPDAPSPIPNAIRGYLGNSRGVWIPSLGLARDDGSSETSVSTGGAAS